ncbi:hypothetical protein [Hymenobacter sp. CRA2]|uniref:hypothetical protein n=1 Tax=Hymenobacter sp. CRA2 TaxID=1955620 RepID=UPI00098EDC7C|nr:hypothetical protein [Hymenobacter sp. CRA2]OON69097.1 hypothetical protein B0919_10325 [Hymenobacter sp. CRA2]
MPQLLNRTLWWLCTALLALLHVQCQGQSKPKSAPASAAAPYQQLLLGRWQSLSDPSFVLRITATAYIEEYKGEKPSSLHYQLTDVCRCNPPAAALKADTKRLLVTYEDSPADCYCYSIDRVDKQYLTLLYIGRGNALRFKRLP